MRAFRVTARTINGSHTYIALGESSIEVHMSALDRFDGICYVSVIPLARS